MKGNFPTHTRRLSHVISFCGQKGRERIKRVKGMKKRSKERQIGGTNGGLKIKEEKEGGRED